MGSGLVVEVALSDLHLYRGGLDYHDVTSTSVTNSLVIQTASRRCERSTSTTTGARTYIEPELAEVLDAIEEANFKTGTFKDLRKRENLQPLLISLLLMFGQQFSGINAVLFYSVSIFEAAKTPLNNFVENIILASVQVCTTPKQYVIGKL